MTRHFADLHSHPSFYTFNRVRNSPQEQDPECFNPWHIPPSNTAAMDEGRRGTAYSQTDVAKMAMSGTRLVFASITPIEAGFLRSSPDGSGGTSFWQEALRMASGATVLKGAMALARKEGQQAALKELTAILRNDGPLRALLQRTVLGYSAERLRFLTSERYDYWEDFLKEYAYFKARDGVTGRAAIEISEGGHRRTEAVKGVYHLIDRAERISEVMDRGEIAVVLTIEGGHVFTIGPDQRRVPEALIFERIETLKALPHPIFFVTLAHHFDNGVCGHAHSIPGIGDLVINQRERLHEGFEAEGDLGLRVTRALLDLDDDLNDLGGRRVLIDAKHFSPRTRKAFYAQIVEPYNALVASGQRQGLPIPVIMSHMAYSGVDTLDALIANGDKETDHWHRGIFNAWGINACDEDMRAAHKSGGLFGLCFDQRILGLRSGDKTPAELLPDVLVDHLLALADVVMLDDRLSQADKRRAWDCLCIGSDFDGAIDPISCCPTVLSLPRFEEALRARLEALAHTRQIAEIGVDALVEKICWKNAFDFVQRHFPVRDAPPTRTRKKIIARARKTPQT